MASPKQRRGVPRLYHKKSKTGCQRCKERRVKCDEKRPSCSGCTRHEVPCIYGTTSTVPAMKGAKRPPSDSSSPSETEKGLAMLPPDDASIFEIPESRSRRLLELRMFHDFATLLTQSYPEPQINSIRQLLATDVSRMALENDNLLYSIFALSASHLLRTDPHNEELLSARERYQCLALREQRQAVANLRAENSDPVCFASLFISENAFATLYERSHEPYTPPMEWLYMGRGAGTLFGMALNRADSNSKIISVVNAPPKIDRDAIITSEELRKPFLYLLKADLPGCYGDIWDPETCRVYAETLCCVGAIQRAIDEHEPTHVIGRWIIAFSLLAPDQFIDFVAEMRPRALIILAQYFGLAAQIDSVWWLGDTTKGEIVAIWKWLPQDCQAYLREPLSRARLSSILNP